MSRYNENKETIVELKGVDLKLDFYWNNRGDLVSWNELTPEPNFYQDVDVKVVVYTFTEDILGGTYTFEVCQVLVNDEVVGSEVLNYLVSNDEETGKVTVKCRVAVGWG